MRESEYLFSAEAIIIQCNLPEQSPELASHFSIVSWQWPRPSFNEIVQEQFALSGHLQRV